MHKKLITVLVSGILSVPMFGCSDSEVEQEPQVKQEQPAEQEEPIDEDLTEEYEEETNQIEQLELAKNILEETAKEHMEGYRHKITTHEESNSVMFTLHATSVDVAKGINDGSYYELTNSMLYLSTEAKGAFERLGLNANCSVCLADLDNDKVWFSTFNETVLFDVTNKLE